MSAAFSRRLRVVALADDAVRLAIAPTCEGCGACSGRCRGILAGLGADADLRVPRAQLPPGLAPGDELLLEVPDGALARRARWLYGAPLAGLLGGALGALALAPGDGGGRDAVVALGALAGLAGGIGAAALIGARATPPFRFASCPSPQPQATPCDP